MEIRQVTLTGVTGAVICVLGPLVLPLPIGPVPVSMASLGIYLAVYILGMRSGFISCMLYLLIGLLGVPVFSGFSAGPGKLLGPTGGYLIGYLFLALICGFFIDKWPGNTIMHFIGAALGTLACYLFGTGWLSFQAGLDLQTALAIGVLPFIPGDLCKIIVSIVIGKQIRRRLYLN